MSGAPKGGFTGTPPQTRGKSDVEGAAVELVGYTPADAG